MKIPGKKVLVSAWLFVAMAIQYNCLFPGIAQKTYLQVGLETSRQNPIEQQNCYLQEIKLFIGRALNVV